MWVYRTSLHWKSRKVCDEIWTCSSFIRERALGGGARSSDFQKVLFLPSRFPPFPSRKLHHQKQSNLVPLRFLFCKISWLGKKKKIPFPVKYYRTWNYNEYKSSIILAVISFYNFYDSTRRALRLLWWTWSASAPSLPLYFVSLESMVLRKSLVISCSAVSGYSLNKPSWKEKPYSADCTKKDCPGIPS